MTCEEHQLKKSRAIELRLAGYSRSQIKSALGIRNERSIQRWLEGIPAPEWTKRPMAKDQLRDEAVSLRKQGMHYNEIRARLGVSKSSLSLWLRDVALSAEQAALLTERKVGSVEKRAASIRAARIRRERGIMDAAAAEIGPLSTRDLFLLGVALYWAEGSKAKPWTPSPHMSFINSDPEMITLYLAWLDLIGIDRSRLVFRLSIHESADVDGAAQYWADLVGVAPEDFRKPTIKTHNPKTIRRKVGVEYVGCLTITVRRGLETYRRVAGWFEGIMTSLGAGVTGIARETLALEDRVRTLGAQLSIAALGFDTPAPERGPDSVGEPRGEYQCRRTA